jgi:hypothetical protein
MIFIIPAFTEGISLGEPESFFDVVIQLKGRNE